MQAHYKNRRLIIGFEAPWKNMSVADGLKSQRGYQNTILSWLWWTSSIFCALWKCLTILVVIDKVFSFLECGWYLAKCLIKGLKGPLTAQSPWALFFCVAFRFLGTPPKFLGVPKNSEFFWRTAYNKLEIHSHKYQTGLFDQRYSTLSLLGPTELSCGLADGPRFVSHYAALLPWLLHALQFTS